MIVFILLGAAVALVAGHRAYDKVLASERPGGALINRAVGRAFAWLFGVYVAWTVLLASAGELYPGRMFFEILAFWSWPSSDPYGVRAFFFAILTMPLSIIAGGFLGTTLAVLHRWRR